MLIAASNLGPLLGRHAEIELLTSALDEIQAGGALVPHGEPGIGKSRLLAVAAGFARVHGFTVLSATGVQSEAHRCGTPATPSTPWAAQPGAPRPAASFEHPGSPAADATSPPATS